MQSVFFDRRTANVFIQAKRFHCPFDIFSGFWESLDREMENNVIASITPIYEELTAGDNNLSHWVVERKNSKWFHEVEEEATQTQYSEIASWAIHPDQNYKQTAQEEFLSVGDSWVVAKAITEGSCIITHEKFDAKSKKKRYISRMYVVHLELNTLIQLS